LISITREYNFWEHRDLCETDVTFCPLKELIPFGTERVIEPVKVIPRWIRIIERVIALFIYAAETIAPYIFKRFREILDDGFPIVSSTIVVEVNREKKLCWSVVLTLCPNSLFTSPRLSITEGDDWPLTCWIKLVIVKLRDPMPVFKRRTVITATFGFAPITPAS
jgi:hypothetical protein